MRKQPILKSILKRKIFHYKEQPSYIHDYLCLALIFYNFYFYPLNIHFS